MTKQKSTLSSGFTIVELAVILGVLVILIIITAVSYSGIRTRTLVANTENNAKLLQKKVQNYFNVNSHYPAPATATTNLNSQAGSKLEGIVTLGTPTAVNGERTMRLQLCTAGGVGYRITHWDYNANVLPSSPQFSGGANVTGCTTWAVAT